MRVDKDPNAKLDFGLNWGPWLKQRDGTTDAISASTWTITGPDNTLTQADGWFEASETGVWLSGGTEGREYKAVNHIVTAAGREDDRTITVRVRQR